MAIVEPMWASDAGNLKSCGFIRKLYAVTERKQRNHYCQHCYYYPVPVLYNNCCILAVSPQNDFTISSFLLYSLDVDCVALDAGQGLWTRPGQWPKPGPTECRGFEVRLAFRIDRLINLGFGFWGSLFRIQDIV